MALLFQFVGGPPNRKTHPSFVDACTLFATGSGDEHDSHAASQTRHFVHCFDLPTQNGMNTPTTEVRDESL